MFSLESLEVGVILYTRLTGMLPWALRVKVGWKLKCERKWREVEAEVGSVRVRVTPLVYPIDR
jgi:hypothetical protein